MVEKPDARLRWLEVARIVVAAALTVAALGTVPGSTVPPVRIAPMGWVEDPPEEVAEEFLRAVAASQPEEEVCAFVTPNFGLLNPCMDDLSRRQDRLTELRAGLSPQVRVGPGTATSATRVDFAAEHLTPRPSGLTLSLTVERDRNNDWRVSRLDDIPIPAG